tara:strand:- start:2906 stop:5857 length:2952 start_codon:yes stop_codon:yes gene_type:complete
MSIDFGENINLTLGRHLPVPYVDKVKIYTDYMQITLAVYFNLPPEKSIKEHLDSLSDIKFYCSPMLEGYSSRVDAYNNDFTLLNADGFLSPVKRIISSKESILKYVPTTYDTFIFQQTLNMGGGDVFYADDTVSIFPTYRANAYVSGEQAYWAMERELSEFEYASKQIVNNQKIYKYITTFPLRFTLWNDYSMWRPSLEFLNALRSNLTLFAFSSAIDLNVDDFFTRIQASVLDNIGIGQLYKASISGLSYQQVFSNGAPIEEKTVLYMTEGGTAYYNIPIQTIDGTFYTTENVTFEQMTTSFSQFIGSVAEEDFQQAINSLAYILATFKESNELLLKLNEYRATFPMGVSNTSLNAWYRKVSNTILRLNNQIKEEESFLSRFLISTPVVIDMRERGDVSTWTRPDYSDIGTSEEDDYIYVKNMIMHRNGVFDNQNPEAQAMESFADQESYVSFDESFVLFDYEKALKTKSVLSKVFDIGKIEQFFGKSITNEHFKLDNIKLFRYQWDTAVPPTFEGNGLPSSGVSLLLAHTTQYASTLEDTYPGFDSSFLSTYSDVFDDAVKTSFPLTYSEPSVSTVTYYPKLLLRNFNTAAGLGDYRMMCFQTSHILGSDGGYHLSNRDNDFIYMEAGLRDYTKEIYNTLTYEYVVKGFELLKYVGAANEFCSYNNIDGQFNDFFGIAMAEEYPDTAAAPWIIAPLLYNFHLDLLYNIWNGDRDTIVLEAIKISEQISPESGDLEYLQNFNDRYTSLFSQHYGETEGVVRSIMDSSSEAEDLSFGGTGNIFYPLPDVDFQNLVQTYTTEDYMMSQIQEYYDIMWESIKHYMNRVQLTGETTTVDMDGLFGALFATDSRRDNQLGVFPSVWNILATYGAIEGDPDGDNGEYDQVRIANLYYSKVAEYFAENRYVANTLKASDAIDQLNESGQSQYNSGGTGYMTGNPPEEPPGSTIQVVGDILLNYFNLNKGSDLPDGTMKDYVELVVQNVM